MSRSSRSSWRRNASSKTVGSTSDGRKTGRVPAATAVGDGAPGSGPVRSVMVSWLLDGRDGDSVEDGPHGGLGRDALRLALEVEDDAVAERRHRDRSDIVGRDVEPAVE